MKQLNVVICGFDHYDGVSVNPSYEVPKALADQGLGDIGALGDVNVAIHTVGLPVSFANAWPLLLESIEAVHADIIIATGLKHAARGVMLERCATNLMDAAKPDIDNMTPTREPIDPDGPAAYWTRLPLRSIMRDFARDGIPATLSSDAGTFVCNSLFYNLLNWTSGQERVLSGFVSFPQVSETGVVGVGRRGLPLERQIDAGRDVVRETIGYYLKPSSSDILID
ncbi:peptidase C15 [Bifidobacterium lemurum]|uniref:Pyroglutamyl-peptidase I n=1 Tax=Bifidobacterium lemurum TaxID=1603886 RepID=A0A261FV84_9BIFI|nr:pyroglutamyl-peptidase I [Bifidobacterium lemurum]OZG63028.1 peptidase C15 [Bifidobacterium lemurum]QOL33368.1 pyroglutamyl-peptidase I [Bifidobacterium lemurum]